MCSLCKSYSLLSQGALLPWQQCFFNLSAVTEETYGTQCAAGYQHAGHARNVYLTPELLPSATACSFAAITSEQLQMGVEWFECEHPAPGCVTVPQGSSEGDRQGCAWFQLKDPRLCQHESKSVGSKSSPNK